MMERQIVLNIIDIIQDDNAISSSLPSIKILKKLMSNLPSLQLI